MLALALATGGAHAAQPDYSGVYDCAGDDHHEGKYTGTVTLQLVPEQSIKSHSAYNFKLEVPGYGVYPGQAAASGNQMAIHFALADQSTKDYGTGLATFKKNRSGKWTQKSTTTGPNSRAATTASRSAYSAERHQNTAQC